MNNEKKTEYHLGSVMINIGGRNKTVQCAIFAKSLAHGMTPQDGVEYLTTLQKGDDGVVYTTVSHLVATTRFSESEFDALFGDIEATPASVVAETVTVM